LILTLYLNYRRKFKYGSMIVIATSVLVICFTITTYGVIGESQLMNPTFMIFVFIFYDKPIDWIIFESIILSIVFCKKILHLYYGTIKAESDGRGSTMIITLPRSLVIDYIIRIPSSRMPVTNYIEIT